MLFSADCEFDERALERSRHSKSWRRAPSDRALERSRHSRSRRRASSGGASSDGALERSRHSRSRRRASSDGALERARAHARMHARTHAYARAQPNDNRIHTTRGEGGPNGHHHLHTTGGEGGPNGHHHFHTTGGGRGTDPPLGGEGGTDQPWIIYLHLKLRMDTPGATPGALGAPGATAGSTDSKKLVGFAHSGFL